MDPGWVTSFTQFDMVFRAIQLHMEKNIHGISSRLVFRIVCCSVLQLLRDREAREEQLQDLETSSHVYAEGSSDDVLPRLHQQTTGATSAQEE